MRYTTNFDQVISVITYSFYSIYLWPSYIIILKQTNYQTKMDLHKLTNSDSESQIFFESHPQFLQNPTDIPL
jgi:hypothetical protein